MIKILIQRKSGHSGGESSKTQQQQSHLMDLLDISLGATSISGPSQSSSDPWGMPVADSSKNHVSLITRTLGQFVKKNINRFQNKMIINNGITLLTQAPDPWGRSSPSATDPWHSNTGAISRQPVSSLAAGNAGATSNVENWIARNHSPSIASGSSNEGWLQNNAAANGNLASNAAQPSDPWLTQPDPWLSKAPEPNESWQTPTPTSKPAVVDPWAPSNSNIGVCNFMPIIQSIICCLFPSFHIPYFFSIV